MLLISLEDSKDIFLFARSKELVTFNPALNKDKASIPKPTKALGIRRTVPAKTSAPSFVKRALAPKTPAENPTTPLRRLLTVPYIVFMTFELTIFSFLFSDIFDKSCLTALTFSLFPVFSSFSTLLTLI